LNSLAGGSTTGVQLTENQVIGLYGAQVPTPPTQTDVPSLNIEESAVATVVANETVDAVCVAATDNTPPAGVSYSPPAPPDSPPAQQESQEHDSDTHDV